MQAFGQVINDQQNRIFIKGFLRPDRFPSNTYPNWLQWKTHFIAVAEANQWTDAEAIIALPIFLNGPALEEIRFAPQELKAQFANEPAPALRALLEHMDSVMGVISKSRAGQIEFRPLVRKNDETHRELARRVRSMGSLVFAHRDVDERDELLREQFLEGSSDPEFLETLLREEARSFSETVNRANDLESISRSIKSHRDTRTATVRVVQEAATSSSPRNLNDLKKQVNGLMVTKKDLTKVMTQFVPTYGDNFRDCQLRPKNLNSQGPRHHQMKSSSRPSPEELQQNQGKPQTCQKWAQSK